MATVASRLFRLLEETATLKLPRVNCDCAAVFRGLSILDEATSTPDEENERLPYEKCAPPASAS